MAIKYKIVTRKNPQDFEAAPKYYAQVVTGAKKNLRDIAERIASHTTMSTPDVFGVLMALEEEVIVALKDGAHVELGNLCILYPTLQCNGADSLEAFNAAGNITAKKIGIRAKKALSNQMANVPLERVG